MFFFIETNNNIRSEYLGNIQEVIFILKENPNLKLKIIGYADRNTNLNKNVSSSYRRARKVANIITKANINPERISYTALDLENIKTVSKKKNELGKRVAFEFFVE